MTREQLSELKSELIEKSKVNQPMKLENTLYKMWECPNCCVLLFF